MTLGRRTILILGILSATSILLTYIVLRVTVYPTFLDLENQDVTENLARVEAAVAEQIYELRLINSEYAHWTETHEFMRDLDPAYIRANVNPSILENIGADGMVIMNRQGDVVASVWIGQDLSENAGPASPFKEFDSVRPDLLTSESGPGELSGVIRTSNGPFLFAALPILRSDESGDARGTVLFGKYLDDNVIRQLEKRLSVKFSVEQTPTPLYERRLRENAGTMPDELPRRQNSKEVLAYHYLADIYGQPAALLEVSTPRRILMAGERTVTTALAFLTITSLLYLFVCTLSLRKLIINPVETMIRYITGLRIGIDIPEPLAVNRADEIGILTRQFNSLMVASRNANLDLVTARDQVELILNAVGDGVIGQDLQGCAVFVNPSAAEMMGYDAGELIGLRPDEFNPSADGETGVRKTGISSVFTAARIGAKVESVETVLMRRDGSSFAAECSSNPIFREGELDGAVVTFRDITERKKYERALVDARSQAEEASKAKSDFLARMSHEIRTPLNGVLGMTDLLMSSTRLSGTQRRYAETIQQSGSTLLAVINDILDFSKIEAGKLELDMVPFNLRRTMEESVQLFAERASSKGVELCCDITPDLHTSLLGDSVRLRQVLINLLGNALKFTQQGEVVLRVAEIERDENRARLRFEIQDTGIGIKPEKQSQIFDLFTQEDGGTTRKFGGTGLGLTISKELVELMGGGIGVDSVPGQGSTFYFTATFDKDQVNTESLQPEALAGMTVMIVDDNMTNREILRHQLESWRIDVLDAASGLEALERLSGAVREQIGLDAILLDMHMPALNGLQLANEIRQLPECKDVPLVMLSSLSIGDNDDAYPHPEMHAWLTKPVRQSLLYDALASIVGAALAEPTDTDSQTKLQAVKSFKTDRAYSVLLAEDNEVNQAVAAGMLTELGYRVETVADGRAAVQCVQRERFDLILMDCQMPDMDGFEATHAIRKWEADQKLPSTPIVALTANALKGDRERCLDAGMTDYVTKPLSLEKLGLALHVSLGDSGEIPERSDDSSLRTDGRQTAADSCSPVDWHVLERLAEIPRPGGTNLRDEAVNIYLEIGWGLKDRLATAVYNEDAAEVNAAAHALKSSSGNIGATTLSELCQQLENLGSEEDLNQAPELIEKCELEFKRVIEELQKYIESQAQTEKSPT